MEIFVYPLCYLPAILALIFPPILPLLQFFIAKIILIVLWAKLIKHKEDDMRALWRFTAEWTLSGGYVVYAIFKYFFENGELFHRSAYLPLPDSLLSKIWTYLNVHFAFAESGYGIIFPWIYVGLAVFLIGMCLFFIARNYIKTKELW